MRTTRWLGQSLSPQEIEYKFVTITAEGEFIWEDGPNRLLCVVPGLNRRDTRNDLVPVPAFAALEEEHSSSGPPGVEPPAPLRRGASPGAEAAEAEAEDPAGGGPAPPGGPGQGEGGGLIIEATCNSTALGDELLAVGALPELGGWAVESALRLATSPDTFPVWSGAVSFDAGDALEAVEWKLVILHSNGSHTWEPGENRSTSLPQLGRGEDLVARASFGGPCEESIRSSKPAEVVPTRSIVSKGLAQQSLIFHAPATASVEVVFEAQALRHLPTYNPSDEAWVLGIAELGLEQGMHAFHALVDGERVLSDYHPSTGDDDPATRQSLVLVDEALWSYAQAFREVHRRQAKRRPAAPRCSRLDEGPARGTSPRKAGMLRPSSTSSTASTCSTSSDKDDEQELAPKPFSWEVFAGLYDGDLQARLGSFHDALGLFLKPQQGQALQLWSGASRLHKPCGRCEDAYFASAKAIGVADGVGSMVQFARYGADAAAYAHELMELAAEALSPDGQASVGSMPNEPVQVRAQAALMAAESTAMSYGASTVATLVVEGDSAGVANLGDSGFMVLRKGAQGMDIVHRSEEMQHHWNCPYQLCRLPPALLKRLQKDTRFDSAADSDCYNVQVQPGDLLLVFTDGLSDNLHEQEIRQIADRALAPMFGELAGLPELSTSPSVVAAALARAAQERSLDPRALTPFSEASKAQGMECPGGKPDDITVVAAWVVPEAR